MDTDPPFGKELVFIGLYSFYKKVLELINNMKKIILIFFIAFILNLIWENLHSVLYDNYKGGEITQFILLRATLSDAIYIVFMVLPFIIFPNLKNKDWLIIIFGFIISISIEYYALGAGRWAYNSMMPIIPFLLVGLTPTIQLGILGYLSYKLEEKLSYFQK